MNNEWFIRLERLFKQKFQDLPHWNGHNNYSEISNEEVILDELIKEKEKSKTQAYKLRKDLLNISENIKEWKSLHEKAKASNANELAKKASDQIKNLMKKGENLWTELDQTGKKFRKIESNIRDFSGQVAQNSNIYEHEWIRLETELELDRLRQKNDLRQ